MPNNLESALVIALRETIKWESSVEAPESGTLTPVNADVPFDASVYQERDRQLAYRDLIVAAAVVEVSVQVGDVYNYSTVKPKMQGPAPFSLPLTGTEAGYYNSQIRHVLNTSIPYDAARYADADLYGRDSLIYETLARACQEAFINPSIPQLDIDRTIITSTDVWSLGEGNASQSDINVALPLDKNLFKNPDTNLADRDNQLAGYVAQLAQVLQNPFSHAHRLYIQVEAYGTIQREADIYALVSDDGTNRVFQTEPALPGANQIIYNVHAETLQWIREKIDEVHVPQIYAMAIPGIELGQTIETLAEVPELKDPQYWRGKASQLNPEGIQLSDTDLYIANTDSNGTGGCMQSGSVSFTVPGQLMFHMDGDIVPSNYRVSVLAKPNRRVEIPGALNISNTDGTLGGATFEINVPSGNITLNQYLVEDGDGIVYSGSLYLPGDVFYGTSSTSAYTQYGALSSTVRQYAVVYSLALPADSWSVYIEYTNMTGVTDSFRIKAEYIASGADAVPVFQDIAPVLFNTENGNTVLTPVAGMDTNNSETFTFPVFWTGGTGQFHIRKLIFESETTQGHYNMTGTFVGSVSQVDVIGNDKETGVLRWQFLSDDSASGLIPFTVNFTDEAILPIQFQQVQVQSLGTYATTPLSRNFQSWRQECLDRSERAIAQGYNLAVQAYGTSVPTFRDSGSNWYPDASENWMSFVEVYNPRVREILNIDHEGITNGFQYQVDTTYVTYDGTVYLQNQKFYGVESAGTVYSDGTVRQVGAFIKSKAGHVGKPALVPLGIYFDGTSKNAKAYYDTALSTPMVVTCMPWMIESGFYVANEDFWMPETLGLTLPAVTLP